VLSDILMMREEKEIRIFKKFNLLWKRHKNAITQPFASCGAHVVWMFCDQEKADMLPITILKRNHIHHIEPDRTRNELPRYGAPTVEGGDFRPTLFRLMMRYSCFSPGLAVVSVKAMTASGGVGVSL